MFYDKKSNPDPYVGSQSRHVLSIIRLRFILFAITSIVFFALFLLRGYGSEDWDPFFFFILTIFSPVWIVVDILNYTTTLIVGIDQLPILTSFIIANAILCLILGIIVRWLYSRKRLLTTIILLFIYLLSVFIVLVRDRLIVEASRETGIVQQGKWTLRECLRHGENPCRVLNGRAR